MLNVFRSSYFNCVVNIHFFSLIALDLLQSIPGIGTKIAATILAEIGEIDRFDHAKNLVAFACIDPSVFSSGKFTATRNKITKRGSRRLRTASSCKVWSAKLT
jgi:transposase